jgi:hypothetical protein
VITASKARVWFIGLILAVIGIPFILLWWGAQSSKRPDDMPADSVWIDASALSFSWHCGWWFGCWIDSDGHSNRCRLWAYGSDKPIVYEGLYVSCDSNSPVPAGELKIKVPPDKSSHMWIGLNQSGEIAPAAFLQNGKNLVPVKAPNGCEDLKRNLELKK